jgi:hypothetical protein
MEGLMVGHYDPKQAPNKARWGINDVFHFVVVKFCPQPGIYLFYLYA